MRRNIEQALLVWKKQKDRYPLLVRGARQVGKSFLVEYFAKENFQNNVVVNFDFQPQLKECFVTLDPYEIINRIQLAMGVQIKEENTLLFLDEIQECPEAIMALRYFKEKMPRLAVIGAGSLLEFALRNSEFKVPVGRIHFLYLEPISFSEFLEASGNQQLCSYLEKIQISNQIEDVIHKKLLELVRLYLILGGMPAVLKNYFENKDLLNCQNIQAGILQTYRADFGKYAKTSQHKYLVKVFDAVPRLIGQRIKYANIDRDTKSRDLKNALDLMISAGIVNPVYLSKASGVPLGAQTNEQKFKLNFLDVGLMQNVCGLQSQLSLGNDFFQINSGAVSEQFVGQELRCYRDKHWPSSLFFWARDKKGSGAEVDYIIEIDSEIFPLEVKAGKTGTLKSLKLFLDEKKSRFGIRISKETLSYYDKILSIPFYMIKQLPRLIKGMK